MRVTFLGTGTSQGVPVVACDCAVCRSSDSKDKRLRSSVLVETEEKCFTIDAGPDFRAQMLRYEVKRLDAVLLTHAHFDHIGGLDDVRSFNYLQQKPMDIYGNRQCLEGLQKTFSYAFSRHHYPGLPEFALHKVDDYSFCSEIPFLALPGQHHKLPVLGYKIGDFAYLTDIKTLPEESLALLQGVKVLVINALRYEPHFSHLNVPEALALIARIAPQEAYLTHISHFLGFHAEVDASLPPHVHLAYDGLVLEID